MRALSIRVKKNKRMITPAMQVGLIERAIAKWDLIAQGLEVDWGHENCMLCTFYFSKIWNQVYNGETKRIVYMECWFCPVKQHSGKKFCVGTPYDKILTAGRTLPSTYKAGCTSVYWLVEAEIEFLINLLPENHVLRSL